MFLSSLNTDFQYFILDFIDFHIQQILKTEIIINIKSSANNPVQLDPMMRFQKLIPQSLDYRHCLLILINPLFEFI